MEEEPQKLKKGWKYGAGSGLLKRAAGTFAIYLFQGLSFLHSEIILLSAKLCYTFEITPFFSTNNFMKKVVLSRLKMKLYLHLRKFGVSD